MREELRVQTEKRAQLALRRSAIFPEGAPMEGRDVTERPDRRQTAR
jgi:hypothetical protein